MKQIAGTCKMNTVCIFRKVDLKNGNSIQFMFIGTWGFVFTCTCVIITAEFIMAAGTVHDSVTQLPIGHTVRPRAMEHPRTRDVTYEREPA